MRRIAVLLGFLLTGIVAASRIGEPSLAITGLGDCEKATRDGAIEASPHFWEPRSRTLRLHGARNEVVGAQLMLTALDRAAKEIDVSVGDLSGPGVIAAEENLTLFRELYQFVENGDWSWGTPSQVLPSRKWYPEVLAPLRNPYERSHGRVGAPFDIAAGENQGIWIDLYIPKNARPGRYTAPIRVTVGQKVYVESTLEVMVHDFDLPDETHVDGYGELYGLAYSFHGAPYRKDPETWWRVARLYHQMAHAHRFVVSEREGEGPPFADRRHYDRFYGTILDGTLFGKDEGYVGPGTGKGAAFWRAPFVQAYDGHVPDFTEKELEAYTGTARVFEEHVVRRGWGKKRFFAYIPDETGTDARSRENERRLQEALDRGAGRGKIPLLWVSHTNPASLASDPARDRRGLTRWWVPNGAACDPAFLKPRIAAGELVWFYHAGHPHVGVHGVNATGVELRTWGTICWRYGLQGSFWWAVDFGDKERPLELPKYKREDTRWGNGVLFYPGARLPDLGLPAVDGPLSSLRMKAYRRGLQDYEYAWLLAQRGKQDMADAIVKRVIPVALTEATTMGKPPWAADVNAWYRMRKDLAEALRP